MDAMKHVHESRSTNTQSRFLPVLTLAAILLGVGTAACSAGNEIRGDAPAADRAELMAATYEELFEASGYTEADYFCLSAGRWTTNPNDAPTEVFGLLAAAEAEVVPARQCTILEVGDVHRASQRPAQFFHIEGIFMLSDDAARVEALTHVAPGDQRRYTCRVERTMEGWRGTRCQIRSVG